MSEDVIPEACRIELRWNSAGAVDVSAPMRYKQLCYEILGQARAVLNATPDGLFWLGWREFAIVMDMRGRVDISAPLPPRELALAMLDRARTTIDQYEGPAEDVAIQKLGN